MTKTEIYDEAVKLDEVEHRQLTLALDTAYSMRYGRGAVVRKCPAFETRWPQNLAYFVIGVLVTLLLSSCTSVVEQTSTAADGTVTVTKRTFKLDGGAAARLLGIYGGAESYTVPTVKVTK